MQAGCRPSRNRAGKLNAGDFGTNYFSLREKVAFQGRMRGQAFMSLESVRIYTLISFPSSRPSPHGRGGRLKRWQSVQTLTAEGSA